MNFILKGFLILACIISEVFEGFLKAYIEQFKYKSITTDDWKEFLYDYFKSKVSQIFSVSVFGNYTSQD